MQIPADGNSEAYLFGGQNETSVLKDMNIFDSVNLKWSLNISAEDFTTPRPRSDYTGTLLKNGMIIYIGGWEIGENGLPVYVDMSQLSIFDTKQSLWGIVTRVDGGDQIGPRRGHQAALTNDEKIIIYGGVMGVGVDNDTWISATPTLAVLDTKKGIFRWSIPQTSEKEPPPLLYSTSIVVGDYMILTFGNITNPLTNPSETSSGLYLLDTRNFTWVDTFDPPKPSSTSYTLIIIIVGSVVGFIILVIILIAFICFYKRRKKTEERDDDNKTNDTSSAIITPGTEHFQSQNNFQDNQNTQNSAQFSPTNSANFSSVSNTSSYRGGRESDGWDNHDRQSPQISQINKKAQKRGSGQQYYQSYTDYNGNNSGRDSGNGGNYYNNNNVYNEYINYNPPIQHRYSPNQPQVVQNDIYSGVIPQYGYIPQQGYVPQQGFIPQQGYIPQQGFVPQQGFHPHQDTISYNEYDQPHVPFYHSSNVNTSYSPTFNDPSYSPPHTPPFYNPPYIPPYNTSYSPSSHSPTFSDPSYLPPFNNPPPNLNTNDPNNLTPYSNNSTNFVPGGNSNNSNGTNPMISRSGSIIDRIRRIGSGRRNRNSSNTTTATNNTMSSRSSYTRSGLINRGNDSNYGREGSY